MKKNSTHKTMCIHWQNESSITCVWLELGCKQFSATVRSSTYFQQHMRSDVFCTATLITWKLMRPILVPCGRLADKILKSERVALYITHCILWLLRKLWNHGKMDLRTLCENLFNQKILIIHVESFWEVGKSHCSHIVEFISTLMQNWSRLTKNMRYWHPLHYH